VQQQSFCCNATAEPFGVSLTRCSNFIAPFWHLLELSFSKPLPSILSGVRVQYYIHDVENVFRMFERSSNYTFCCRRAHDVGAGRFVTQLFASNQSIAQTIAFLNFEKLQPLLYR
jgi:hypothetical protein